MPEYVQTVILANTKALFIDIISKSIKISTENLSFCLGILYYGSILSVCILDPDKSSFMCDFLIIFFPPESDLTH